MRRPSIPVDILFEECLRAIKKEINKKYYLEAKEIVKLASDDERREFLKYFKEDKGNICCLVLDTIKRDLVAAGKMQQNDNDSFGKPMIF
jgi:hypothetical protein